MAKVQSGEKLRVESTLRIDELQVATGVDNKGRPGFRAHADPVQSCREIQRTIGFHPYFETSLVQRLDQALVHLQQWLPASADDIGFRAARPLPRHGVGELRRRREFASAGSVRSDEIRVTKAAGRLCAIGFAPGPKIATRKAQENGGTPALSALALQRVINFLYLVRGDLSAA